MKNININIMIFDEISLSIQCNDFEFSYSQLRNDYRAIGFACNFHFDSEESKNLQDKLEKLSETILKGIKEL